MTGIQARIWKGCGGLQLGDIGKRKGGIGGGEDGAIRLHWKYGNLGCANANSGGRGIVPVDRRSLWVTRSCALADDLLDAQDGNDRKD